MIQSSNRQQIVDTIRGISLLGILLSNMLIFQFGMLGKDELELFQLSAFEKGMHVFVKIVIESSFMPIFTFLFGFGLYKMMESLENKGLKFRRILSRRYLLLLGLGFLHSHFIWEGDILLFYGLMGFFLFFFLRRKAKTVLIWAIVLLSILGLAGLIGGSELTGTTGLEKEKVEAYIIKSKEAYGNGTYGEVIEFRKEESPMLEDEWMLLVALLVAPLLTAPLFLLGIYAAKKNWFKNPLENRRFFFRNASIFIPIGLILKTISNVWPESLLSGFGIAVGGTILAIGYMMGFAWLLAGRQSSALTNGFTAVGKLSLTNYLMQSVIATTIFYGYGLGLFGKAGVTAGIGIALGIYVLQMIASSLYLKRFSIGPVEWLLRIWTYWSWKGKPKQKAPKAPDIGVTS
ncbi:DUF418 domain-containing protein [Paenibacillus sp. GCM10027627]|uniref:DUF418 domain-containing protein n=1 Tax=unclassified Paenibacillus TaxID=185978 RepID=UPI003633A564